MKTFRNLFLFISCFSLFTMIGFARPTLSEGAECNQYDFGGSSLQYYVYSDGRTWNFTAEKTMVVKALEVKSVLGSNGGTFHVQIKINDTLVASWDHYVNSTLYQSYVHEEDVNLNLNIGDKITYRIYGGTQSSPVGGITGENYVKLCDFGSIKPDIKANDRDGSVTITPTDTLSVTLAFSNGGNVNNADWWILWETPWGWYYYDLTSGWTPGLNFTYQGPLFGFAPFEILNISGFPEGSYNFYFGVDVDMNGKLETSVIYDSVNVTISTTSMSDVVGKWSINFDWDCDGNASSSTWSIRNDGTFESGSSSGTWTQVANEITLTFPNGTTYIGTIDLAGDFLEGTMIGYTGSDGCWDAERIS